MFSTPLLMSFSPHVPPSPSSCPLLLLLMSSPLHILSYSSCPLLLMSSPSPHVLSSSSCLLLLISSPTPPHVFSSSCPLLLLMSSPPHVLSYSSCPLLLMFSPTPHVLSSSCPLLLMSSPLASPTDSPPCVCVCDAFGTRPFSAPWQRVRLPGQVYTRKWVFNECSVPSIHVMSHASLHGTSHACLTPVLLRFVTTWFVLIGRVVVTFRSPTNPDQKIIKRIIALEGDTVR